VDESFFKVKPDVILVTHDHLDHLDPETLDHYLLDSSKPITVMAPEAAYRKLVKYGGPHNYVRLSPHSVWSTGGVTFYSVKAEHSDPTAAGFILDDGVKTFYISGDTLYNYDVIDDVVELVDDGVDYAFLPINGVGNNMNAKDAADFAYEIGAKCAVPLHWGLFDSIDPKDFDFDDSLILNPYEETGI
jgi:L-ascorbate 6-phosphate lactonase